MISRARTIARQFGQTMGEFDLVRGKIAEAAADTYAMEKRHVAYRRPDR